MRALSLLRTAAVILVVSMGVGWQVQEQRAHIHERYRQSSDTLARITHYGEQLTHMLTVGALEHDLFRVVSYASVLNELEGSLQEAQQLTQSLKLSSEMDSLVASNQVLRELEQHVIAWMQSNNWRQARQVLLSEDYVMTRKLHDIDRESAVGALTGELSSEALLLDRLHHIVLLLQAVAVLMVIWTSVRHALLLRTQVKDLQRLQQAQENAQKQLEAQVQARTAELEAANTRLVRLSTTDALTGIANRRHLDEVMVREYLRAQRSGTSLAVALVDVDWFKPYNDHYGHQAGDTCLQAVANILTRTITRAGDLVARYGGEEFVVVAPATDVQGMCEVARRVQHNLQSIALTHEHSPMRCVTVSIGVAACVPGQFGAMTPEALLQQADLVLYKAKQSGRNCVVTALDMDAQQLSQEATAQSLPQSRSEVA